jgi:hypothetical protein
LRCLCLGCGIIEVYTHFKKYEMPHFSFPENLSYLIFYGEACKLSKS